MTRSSTVRFVGIKEVAARLQRSKGGVQSAAGRGALIQTRATFAVTQALVPKETTRLMRSGRIQGPYTAPGIVSYAISYGGRAYGVDYAIYVHEDLTAKHAPPTQAKFVESPMLNAGPGLGEEVRKQVAGYIEGTFR